VGFFSLPSLSLFSARAFTLPSVRRYHWLVRTDMMAYYQHPEPFPPFEFPSAQAQKAQEEQS
jgi:hypothetical protein